MKRLQYIIPMVALLLMTACDSDDDGFYNTKYIEATNLVAIETQPSYAVGDDLIVTAEIPNLIPEAGFDNPLNIQTTTAAQSIRFNYVLEKRNGDIWEYVDATNIFTAYEGSGIANLIVEGKAEFNIASQSYLFSGGIELQQTGDYRLSYGYNSRSTNKVELFSDSPGNNIIVKFNSTTTNLNSDGFYLFTVN